MALINGIDGAVTNVIIIKIAKKAQVKPWNTFDEINNLFKEDFDIYILVKRWIPNCYSYLIKPEGAKKLLDHFTNTSITQSLDWELAKLDGNDLFKVLWSDRDKFSKSCDSVISKSDIISDGEIYVKIG